MMFETGNEHEWEVQADGTIRIYEPYREFVDLSWFDLRAMLKEMEKQHVDNH